MPVFLSMNVSSDTCYKEFMGPRPSFKYTDPPPTARKLFVIHRKGRLIDYQN